MKATGADSGVMAAAIERAIAELPRSQVLRLAVNLARTGYWKAAQKVKRLGGITP